MKHKGKRSISLIHFSNLTAVLHAFLYIHSFHIYIQYIHRRTTLISICFYIFFHCITQHTEKFAPILISYLSVSHYSLLTFNSKKFCFLVYRIALFCSKLADISTDAHTMTVPGFQIIIFTLFSENNLLKRN